MIIVAVATLALYCPRCGKIQTHDISRFDQNKAGSRALLCSCGQVQATISGARHRQYLLNIPCIVCQTNHIICLDSRSFFPVGTDDTALSNKVEKIYCPEENIELGFVGDRPVIQQTIAEHKQEFDRLVQEDEFEYDDCGYDEYVENPQVMFEILNKVHDIAEKGGVFCRCGSLSIEAEVLPECIELKCRQCGSRQIIPAQSDQDLTQAELLETIELVPVRWSRSKH